MWSVYWKSLACTLINTHCVQIWIFQNVYITQNVPFWMRLKRIKHFSDLTDWTHFPFICYRMQHRQTNKTKKINTHKFGKTILIENQLNNLSVIVHRQQIHTQNPSNAPVRLCPLYNKQKLLTMAEAKTEQKFHFICDDFCVFFLLF